jgi:hypothetical protein
MRRDRAHRCFHRANIRFADIRFADIRFADIRFAPPA